MRRLFVSSQLLLFLPAFFSTVESKDVPYCLDESSFIRNVSPGIGDSLVVYLSFDDGPVAESRYIDTLILRDSIPVNVFLIGQKVFANEEAIHVFHSYRSNPLVEMENHSYTHALGKFRLYYENPVKVVNDIILNEDTLHLANKIARLPGRNAWRVGNKHRTDLADAIPAADSLAARGYTLFGWDLEWRYDSSGYCFYSAEQMIKEIRYAKTFLPRHVVILCHDAMLQDKYFRSQLQAFTRRVRSIPGHRFERLSHYPR